MQVKIMRGNKWYKIHYEIRKCHIFVEFLMNMKVIIAPTRLLVIDLRSHDHKMYST